MKTQLLALTLLASTLAPALASAANLTCTRSELGNDNYFSITIDSREITFSPHESGFSVARSRVKTKGTTYAILDQKVPYASEGVESVEKVDALLIYNPAANTMNATVLVGGIPFIAGEQLDCSKN